MLSLSQKMTPNGRGFQHSGAASQSDLDRAMVKHKLWGQRLSRAAGKAELPVPLQAVGGVLGEQP